MAKELAGQAAIVTGGGRGFGRSIALRLAAEGAAVTVTARSLDELRQTAGEDFRRVLRLYLPDSYPTPCLWLEGEYRCADVILLWRAPVVLMALAGEAF